jgi:uncharacterized membrane protein
MSGNGAGGDKSDGGNPPASERTRLLAALVVGMVVAAAVSHWSPWQLTVLAGWDTVAVALLSRQWWTIARAGPRDARRLARLEDDTRAMVRAVVVVASVVTLAGVLLAVARAHEVGGAEAVVLVVTALVTVVLSWALVHSTFTIRYADLFYRDPVGGVDFSQDQDPDLLDFAYLAFTIGMTYQVSDTDISDRAMRRSVLAHAVVSFVFGTAIVALTINLVAGLLN